MYKYHSKISVHPVLNITDNIISVDYADDFETVLAVAQSSGAGTWTGMGNELIKAAKHLYRNQNSGKDMPDGEHYMNANNIYIRFKNEFLKRNPSFVKNIG